MSVWAMPVTRIWLALMAVTVVTTWGLTESFVAPVVGTLAILLLVAVKIGAVMSHFMELRIAPRPWQAYFAAWVVVVTGVVGGFYLATV